MGLNHENNRRLKISWHNPFKHGIPTGRHDMGEGWWQTIHIFKRLRLPAKRPKLSKAYRWFILWNLFFFFLKFFASLQRYNGQFVKLFFSKIVLKKISWKKKLSAKQGFGAGATRSRGIWLEPEPELWLLPGSGSSLTFLCIIHANCILLIQV